MDFLKKLIETKEEVVITESTATETFEMEGDDHVDYGRVSVSVWSFDMTDVEAEREHHERQVDVDDFVTTPEYTEAKDGRVTNIKAYVDIGADVGTFIISFSTTNFWADKYFNCFNDGATTFDVSELTDHTVVDERTKEPLNVELPPEQEEFIVKIVKGHLSKTMGQVFKTALCSQGEDEYDGPE